MNSKNVINSILNLLVSTLANEVSDRLMSTVEEHLHDKLASTPKSQKLLIDSDELAEQLSLSKSTIINLRKQGLPIIKIGDSVRFDPKVVMPFIYEQFKSKKDETNKNAD